MPQQRFAKALAEAIGARKQSDVAEMTGVAQSTISNYLRCRQEPDLVKVRAIEDGLGCKPGTLTAALGWVPLEALTADRPLTFEEWLDGQGDAVTPDQRAALVAMWAALAGARDGAARRTTTAELAAETDEALTTSLRRREARAGAGARRAPRAAS